MKKVILITLLSIISAPAWFKIWDTFNNVVIGCNCGRPTVVCGCADMANFARLYQLPLTIISTVITMTIIYLIGYKINKNNNK